MLVLFDIDGTLVGSGGVGRAAMEDAGRELFDASFSCEGISFLGSLDVNLYDELCERHSIADPEAYRSRFRSTYADYLRKRTAEPGSVWQLPGVSGLVAALGGVAGLTLGILSGNFEETGRLKVAAAGLDPDEFPICAWGDDGQHRRDLPPVALQRYTAATGNPIPPSRVVVIGDTTRDVDCARATGCSSLAVATGFVDPEELRASGADRVVENLAQTDDIVSWILHRVGAHG